MGRNAVLVGHAFLGWAICGGTIAAGRLFFSIPTTLIVHAIVAPIVFALLSVHFLQTHPEAPLLRTSVVMMGVVIGLDGVVVAPFVEHSYAMFASPLGTWIPFVSMWLASFLTGHTFRQRRRSAQVSLHVGALGSLQSVRCRLLVLLRERPRGEP